LPKKTLLSNNQDRAGPLPHEARGKSGPENHCNEQKAHFSAIRQLKKGATFRRSRVFAGSDGRWCHECWVYPIYEHINMLGRYSFVVPEAVARGGLRPLRDPAGEHP
jgi:hypothetical protein